MEINKIPSQLFLVKQTNSKLATDYVSIFLHYPVHTILKLACFPEYFVDTSPNKLSNKYTNYQINLKIQVKLDNVLDNEGINALLS